MSERCSEVLAEVSRTIEALVRGLALPAAPRRLLDVGCWDGAATTRWAAAIGAAPAGIEIFPEPAAAARARGVEVAALDLEREAFPWEDGRFDVAIANQVFEHLKNVWLPLAEIHRVLKPGGALVLSVPNLASLHNRALLGLGRQPTSIRTLGPHVRGYALGEIRDLVALDGAFTIERATGVGFYPLPARAAGWLARLWPGASHTALIVARRARVGAGSPWRAWLERERADGVQTSWS